MVGRYYIDDGVGDVFVVVLVMGMEFVFGLCWVGY